MADPLLAQLGAFIERKLRKLRLARLYPGVTQSQAVDGTVDVKPDDTAELGEQGFSGVKLALGLPGFVARVPAGVRGRQWWDAWDPSRPFFGLFDQGSEVTQLTFDGGTKAVARVDDTVDFGTLSAVAPGGGGPVTFTWIPPGGGVPVVSTSINVIGKIISGNGKLRA